jgi:hypothetical protein
MKIFFPRYWERPLEKYFDLLLALPLNNCILLRDNCDMKNFQ